MAALSQRADLLVRLRAWPLLCAGVVVLLALSLPLLGGASALEAEVAGTPATDDSRLGDLHAGVAAIRSTVQAYAALDQPPVTPAQMARLQAARSEADRLRAELDALKEQKDKNNLPWQVKERMAKEVTDSNEKLKKADEKQRREHEKWEAWKAHEALKVQSEGDKKQQAKLKALEKAEQQKRKENEKQLQRKQRAKKTRLRQQEKQQEQQRHDEQIRRQTLRDQQAEQQAQKKVKEHERKADKVERRRKDSITRAEQVDWKTRQERTQKGSKNESQRKRGERWGKKRRRTRRERSHKAYFAHREEAEQKRDARAAQRLRAKEKRAEERGYKSLEKARVQMQSEKEFNNRLASMQKISEADSKDFSKKFHHVLQESTFKAKEKRQKTVLRGKLDRRMLRIVSKRASQQALQRLKLSYKELKVKNKLQHQRIIERSQKRAEERRDKRRDQATTAHLLRVTESNSKESVRDQSHDATLRERLIKVDAREYSAKKERESGRKRKEQERNDKRSYQQQLTKQELDEKKKEQAKLEQERTKEVAKKQQSSADHTKKLSDLTARESQAKAANDKQTAARLDEERQKFEKRYYDKQDKELKHKKDLVARREKMQRDEMTFKQKLEKQQQQRQQEGEAKRKEENARHRKQVEAMFTDERNAKAKGYTEKATKLETRRRQIEEAFAKKEQTEMKKKHVEQQKIIKAEAKERSVKSDKGPKYAEQVYEERSIKRDRRQLMCQSEATRKGLDAAALQSQQEQRDKEELWTERMEKRAEKETLQKENETKKAVRRERCVKKKEAKAKQNKNQEKLAKVAKLWRLLRQRKAHNAAKERKFKLETKHMQAKHKLLESQEKRQASEKLNGKQNKNNGFCTDEKKKKAVTEKEAKSWPFEQREKWIERYRQWLNNEGSSKSADERTGKKLASEEQTELQKLNAKKAKEQKAKDAKAQKLRDAKERVEKDAENNERAEKAKEHNVFETGMSEEREKESSAKRLNDQALSAKLEASLKKKTAEYQRRQRHERLEKAKKKEKQEKARVAEALKKKSGPERQKKWQEVTKKKLDEKERKKQEQVRKKETLAKKIKEAQTKGEIKIKAEKKAKEAASKKEKKAKDAAAQAKRREAAMKGERPAKAERASKANDKLERMRKDQVMREKAAKYKAEIQIKSSPAYLARIRAEKLGKERAKKHEAQVKNKQRQQQIERNHKRWVKMKERHTKDEKRHKAKPELAQKAHEKKTKHNEQRHKSEKSAKHQKELNAKRQKAQEHLAKKRHEQHQKDELKDKHVARQKQREALEKQAQESQGKSYERNTKEHTAKEKDVKVLLERAAKAQAECSRSPIRSGSLAGLFWSWSEWPSKTVRRANGVPSRHYLSASNDGTVHVALSGGVNNYEVRAHNKHNGDIGGVLAVCGPSTQGARLTSLARLAGWSMRRVSYNAFDLIPPASLRSSSHHHSQCMREANHKEHEAKAQQRHEQSLKEGVSKGAAEHLIKERARKQGCNSSPIKSGSIEGLMGSWTEWPTRRSRSAPPPYVVSRHYLGVSQHGTVHVGLWGGIGGYTVRAHDAYNNDIHRFPLARCGPNTSGLALTSQAARAGWTMKRVDNNRVDLIPPKKYRSSCHGHWVHHEAARKKRKFEKQKRERDRKAERHLKETVQKQKHEHKSKEHAAKKAACKVSRIKSGSLAGLFWSWTEWPTRTARSAGGVPSRHFLSVNSDGTVHVGLWGGQGRYEVRAHDAWNRDYPAYVLAVSGPSTQGAQLTHQAASEGWRMQRLSFNQYDLIAPPKYRFSCGRREAAHKAGFEAREKQHREAAQKASHRREQAAKAGERSSKAAESSRKAESAAKHREHAAKRRHRRGHHHHHHHHRRHHGHRQGHRHHHPPANVRR